jgi:hypothetical protein
VAEDQAAAEPFQIVNDAGSVLPTALAAVRVPDQLSTLSSRSPDLFLDPAGEKGGGAQEASAHRGAGQVQDREEGAFPLAADDRLGEFQVAPRGLVNDQKAAMVQGLRRWMKDRSVFWVSWI